MPLIGGMMLMVGVQFVRPILKLRDWPLYLALLTAGVWVMTNMGIGFVAGLAGVFLLRWLMRRGVLKGIM